MSAPTAARTARAKPSAPSAPSAPAAPAAAATTRPAGAATIDGAERENLIALAAYYRAQGRGFAPGHEIEDWLAAEGEIDRELAGVVR